MTEYRPKFEIREETKVTMELNFGEDGSLVCPHCKKKVTLVNNIDLK